MKKILILLLVFLFALTKIHPQNYEVDISNVWVENPNVQIVASGPSCEGEPVELSASGGDYLWSTGHTTASITVSPTVPTWYYVTVTNSYGCSDVDSVYVIVSPKPVITFDLPTDVCAYSSPVPLLPLVSVSPYNGGQIDISGPGVSNGVFYPSTVGPGGTVMINATYIDPLSGCESSVDKLITTHPPPAVTFNIPIGSVCLNDPPFLITGGTPIGGVVDGPGVDSLTGIFTPYIAGAGTHQIIYTYTDPYGCIAIASDNIVVNAPVFVSISTPATQLCTGDAPIVLTAYPSGGYYMVDGVSSGAQFDPSYWGSGNHTVVYSLPSVMCGGSEQITIQVLESPVVTLTGPSYMELGSSPVQLVVSPPGGQLTVNGNVAGVYFDPSYWGVGVYNVVYTYSNGVCEESASLTIIVGTTGIDDVSLSSLIDLFPNPTQDVLNIRVGDVQISEIQMFDLMGKVIYETKVESDYISIDMYDFTPGMYFVRFVTSDGLISEPFKVMKQ